MTSVAIPQGRQTFVDPLTGEALALGTLEHYIPFTTTPKLCWADEPQTLPQPQPIVLDASGQCSLWGDGLYRQILKRHDGTVIWDLITGFLGGGGGGGIIGPALTTPGNFALWADAVGGSVEDGGTPGALAFLTNVNNTNWLGTALAVANGGTGAVTAAAARTNLGLVIGTNVQAFDAKLLAIAGLAPSGDQVTYWTSGTTVALFTFTAFMRGVAGAATAAAALTALGAEPATLVNGINNYTLNTTLALVDAGQVVEMNAAGALNLTIPPNSSVAFPVKTRIDIVQIGAGQVSFVAGAGVTIRSSGGKLKLTGQYSGACLYKRGTDEWVLMGDIAA